MSEKAFVVILLAVGCIWGYVVTKATPTVQPAPEVTTTTSTEAEPQEVAVVAVPSKSTDASFAMPATEAAVISPVAFETPPQPSPPARNAVTATGRTSSACGPGMNCSGAAVPQRYQQMRRALLPWRRR
jgi:hypothetical protein